MMRQNERRHVIRRLFTPPPFPLLVRPWTAHRSEHVSPEDPGADVVETLRGEIVIDSRFPFVTAVLLLPGARMEEPIEQLRPAHAERILKILVRTGTKTVDGHRKAEHS